jgi:predicted TIM-barrel fold metal-dependent hydrolase
MRTTVDADWAAMLARLVRESELDQAVALGFDGVYDRNGMLDPEHSQMIVPPGWVFRMCQEHPELLPGPSINPYRRDALERLDECIARGAVLLKWLPIVQAINPGDPGLARFYQRMADARLPLLVHASGGEQTFATVTPEYNDVRLLEVPLDAGVPVICAHSGTRVHGAREPDQLPALRELLVRYPHLWVDNSGLANPSRFAHLPRLAGDPTFNERTVYGSDWPVPSNAFYFLRKLGAHRVYSLERQMNALQRDIDVKRALGYPEVTLTGAARVLPCLDRWRP